MKKNLITLMIIIAVVSCYNPTDNKNKKNEIVDIQQKQRNDSIVRVKTDSLAKINLAMFVKDKKRFEILKMKFKLKEDEFNNSAWYIHKNQTVDNSYNRKCLKTHINSDGYIYLEDQYYSEDWIFHTQIEVKVGNDVYSIEIVESFDENNKTENGSGSVWENISYTDNKDNGIIKAIAESGPLPVKVRFVGKQYYDDFTLSNKDKVAIKDGYELSELIKKLKNNNPK